SSSSGRGGGGFIGFDAGLGDTSAPFVTTQCFDWPGDAGAADAGPCPTDLLTVVELITGGACPTGGWDPYKIDSGPTRTAMGQCCYEMEMMLCLGGGRPCVIDGQARVAPPARGPGWAHGASPAVDGLTPDDRAALAAAWTADGLLEHASVASFSRFSLALLA